MTLRNMSPCDAAEPTEPVSENKSKYSEKRMVMRLHIARGSFFTAGADLEAGCPSMDAELWSKLPEDIIWRVVQLVPAAKHFQLQLVSRKWRQELTSAPFRNTIAAVGPRESEEGRVIACIMTHNGDHRRLSNLKVLDIDLSSIVPSWFWKAERSYSVVAAANGLVCMSNDNRYESWEKEAMTNQYCVVNPLTRTCIVLPKLPFQPGQWLPPSTTTLTICNDCKKVGEGTDLVWGMATYDLATGGGWEVATYRLAAPMRNSWMRVILCAGETFLYVCDQGKVHVLGPCPGPNGLVGEVAASLDAPSAALLGLDAAYLGFDERDVAVVAHRRTLFFIARLQRRRDRNLGYKYCDIDLVCGVWRLARDRMEWEAVARLELPELERLTGLGEDECRRARLAVLGACGVGELLCCCLQFRLWGFTTRPDRCFLLGFNLDTGKWDVLHSEQALLYPELNTTTCSFLVVDPFELRPDLFLPETGCKR